ncbi:hypothetical protein SDC9_198475 [bioreactor metagenome]|uniref:Uncharacterized protein n=1 Tax=bioreactor metagenome TaxID=1076179 RepID=A0A645IIM7_9ZZZZ
MGRHLRGHPHGYAVGTVHQEIGELGRQDRRLLQGTVVVVREVHGVLVQIRQEVR